ncbi:hypothetical protein CK203_048820 [Vitis vinifera]|uniref:Uncharacterized protein n=1 Tax=Vitis vinifera TaxID=29760 RepID=A0A438GU27_VITVI|nr:hypothetical protein CK203_105348 [Vitis vinifera]RVW75700.1 hypothetical protein CK203_048820 [Vitis vinifera]
MEASSDDIYPIALFGLLLCGQNAMENDELDEKNGLLEVNYENAHNAYCRSFLQPQVSSPPESSSMQPLVSST